jgi:hypothetical protein
VSSRRWFLIAAWVALAAGSALAKPDFSGEWKMNPAKSDYGQVPMPASIVRTIQHAEPNISIKTVQQSDRGEITTDLKFTTDGKEGANEIRGSEVKGTARWQGDTLVIETRREMQGAQIRSQDRWTLSGDGRTLTVLTNVKSPAGDMNVKVTFDKQ